MNRFVKIALAILIVLAIPKLIQQVFFGKPSAEKELAKLAAELNATLPKKIDANTTMTGVDLANRVWRVNYEMDKGSTIDRAQSATYKSYAVRQICGSKMKRLLDEKITIEYRYVYEDASGKQELSIAVPPGSCA